ncbi:MULTISPECIES: hypothetical protein [unclassified Microbacterium]|uniref:hypothetical protein n=1 Tax=unclassified Microbacterium TaxID=2609290 RepID=UPI00040A134C|nr:hypothetical protein [Microbacterium sp. B24]
MTNTTAPSPTRPVAPLVGMHSRRPLTADAVEKHVANVERGGGFAFYLAVLDKVPGQLWERAAEGRRVA